MGIQLRNGVYHYIVDSHTNVGLSLFSSPEASFNLRRKLVTEKDRVSISRKFVSIGRGRRRRRNRKGNVVEASNGVNVAPFWNDKASSAPCLSDVFWPSAGAFAAMAILGKMDQILAPKGISITIAPLGAVSTVLFATPSTPAARKYNMFMAQIGCAAIGVVAFSIFGPGWFAKSSALAASIAFMIYTRSIHPPAASLPLLFIDGAKFHNLKFWYAFFPGAAGCILLCFIQQVVLYLKENLKF